MLLRDLLNDLKDYNPDLPLHFCYYPHNSLSEVEVSYAGVCTSLTDDCVYIDVEGIRVDEDIDTIFKNLPGDIVRSQD